MPVSTPIFSTVELSEEVSFSAAWVSDFGGPTFVSEWYIEERLKLVSVEQREYSDLWATWDLNKQALEPVLSTIIKDYPHFCFHDASHSESILLNVERLLDFLSTVIILELPCGINNTKIVKTKQKRKSFERRDKGVRKLAYASCFVHFDSV